MTDMSIPTPREGDEQDSHPLGAPTNRPAGPGKDKYGDTVWTDVPNKPGYQVDKDGRLKYNPSKDPMHPLGPKPTGKV